MPDPLGSSFIMTFFLGGAASRGVSVLRRGSAPCALQSNETFPAVAAAKLTASQAGAPPGCLVRMLGYNCTACWQGGNMK